MHDEPLKGNLTLTDGEQEAFIPDVPRKILEALYATVSRATDSLSQRLRSPSIIKGDDIEQLIEQLSQWTQQYYPVSRNLSITTSLTPKEEVHGSRRSKLNSLEAFQREIPPRTEETETIILVFDFLARNEDNGDITQTELTLELKGTTRRIYYRISDKNPLGDTLGLHREQWTAQAQIKYTDVIVARGLMALVNDWYSALPKREFPRIGRVRQLLHQHDQFDEYNTISILFKNLPFIIAAGFSTPAHSIVQTQLPNTPAIAIWISLVFTFVLLSKLFFAKALSIYERHEDEYNVPLLELTSGDGRRLLRFNKALERSEARLNFWVKTVLAGTSISLFVSLLLLFLS